MFSCLRRGTLNFSSFRHAKLTIRFSGPKPPVVEVARVVKLVNQIPGPQVRGVSRKIGYGLFADRDYPKGVTVTYYGGRSVRTIRKNHNAYTIDVGDSNDRFLDATITFDWKDKGRWVNAAESPAAANVMFDRTTRENGFSDVAIVTTKPVTAGEQFWCDYGKHYEYHWRK